MKLTISLLQAYDWYNDCPPSWKKSAFQQMVDSLNKKPFSSKAMERGAIYEDKINNALLNGEEVAPELEHLRGLQQQGWLLPFTIAGVTFRGRMDYFDAGKKIYDLKTTKKLNIESYKKKWQHIVYMLAMGVKEFQYDIAVFDDETGLEPSKIVSIPITLQENDWQRLAERIEEFKSFLKRHDLWGTYINVYNAK